MARQHTDSHPIDRSIALRQVISWRIVGACYVRGRRSPGFIHLALNGGGYLYFDETWSLESAIANARARGYDTAEVQAKIAQWVETGTGATFTLRRL